VATLSVCLAWPELQYQLFARHAQAEVTEVREVVESQRRNDQLLIEVHYRFDDQGRIRVESDRVPVSWPHPQAGGSVAVEYLHGQAAASRLTGHHNLPPIAFLVVVLGAIIGFMIPQLMRSEREHVTQQSI
jgi:hypothetical protein